MHNYFAQNYVSNSHLTRLKMSLITHREDREAFNQNWKIGQLLDSMLTTPREVNLLSKIIRGYDYVYTDEEIQLVKNMRNAAEADPFYKSVAALSTGQKEFYKKDVVFSLGGIEFTLNCKCKYDRWGNQLGWGIDIKKTKAKTKAQFIEHARHWDYLRQRVFYMKVSGAKQDLLMGVSEIKPYPVFHVTIREGDELYQEGERNMLHLAYSLWVFESEKFTGDGILNSSL